jgi:branched-chain amino acid transport system substrate-binding protein
MGEQLRKLRGRVLLLAACTAVAAAAGCSEDNGTSSGGGDSASTEAAGPKCGMGNGQKAAGEPIKLGAIITQTPGINFSDISDISQAYFDCVNENGGINGRPIEFVVEKDALDPQRTTSLATKLVEDEKVDAMVGSASILDCTVNHEYYEKNDLNLIVAGIGRECFTTPNVAAVNMGPLYSATGAAQYLVKKGAKSIVVVIAQAPGSEVNNTGAIAVGRRAGLKTQNISEQVPINDPAGLALKLANLAGEGGGIIFQLDPPQALKLLQAAEQQGLIDKVHWAASTASNDVSIAKALSPAWNGKFGVNSEFQPSDFDGPDSELYRQITKKYSPSTPLASYGQMGFLTAKIATDTLLKLPEDQLNRKGINAAFRQIKNFTSDILCKPWYFQDMKAHIPNNTDLTVVYKDGKFVPEGGCFDIEAVTPELQYVRQFERDNDVNSGDGG